MKDEQAETTFRRIRWHETEGQPVCPHCGGTDAYDCRRLKGAPRFRCRACGKDFSITSGTLFASHKRKVVVVVRERDGSSLPAVFRSESHALDFIRHRVAKGTTINVDEAGSWEGLSDRFEVRTINHQEAYSADGACTNWAEEFFSRMRRAEIGHHHHIAGAYLLRYAQEASWREDNRRASNGDQVARLTGLAMKRKQSVDFTGYWQRRRSTAVA